MKQTRTIFFSLCLSALSAAALIGCVYGNAGDDIADPDTDIEGGNSPNDARIKDSKIDKENDFDDDAPDVVFGFEDGQAKGGSGGSKGDGAVEAQYDALEYDTGSGGFGGTGGSGASGGTGGSGASGGTGESGASGETGSCTSPNSCASAMILGQFAADNKKDDPTPYVLNTVGHTSKWIRVRALELNEGLVGQKLSARITLTPAMGTNYNLYVFMPQNNSSVACSEAELIRSSMNPMNEPEVVTLEWGEPAVPNGTDDHRWISIEVKHMMGTCDASKQWNLKIEGNVK